ncbi:hypothetical protein V8G54_022375 [Vigna mungo]|uniref:Photosystem II core complex proteins psbY, chloroplastic n=1 Tax=Vigna mungo TaxID=3915 RepID=A0AAQ3NF29_VIGMU
MAIVNTKSLKLQLPPSKPTLSLFSHLNLPKGLTSTVNATLSATTSSMAGYCDAAFAASQIAQIAEGDNRGLALLLPVVPALAWVLFNILQPALNQVNRMRSSKGVMVGLGLGLGASGLVWSPEASASEMGLIADAAAGSDNRGQLLLLVVAPAIGWVLFNILQPALNQLNRMRSK